MLPTDEIDDMGAPTVTVMVVPDDAVAGSLEHETFTPLTANVEPDVVDCTALVTLAVVAPGRMASRAPTRAADVMT